MNYCPKVVTIGILSVLVAILGTYGVMKSKPRFDDLKELDIAIVTLMIAETKKHCNKIKSKNFYGHASGLDIQVGCKK